ncbi:hypothetical protein G3M48_010486 [Beauveria asiatica]|uniref:Uncharacterized protein n=1 Tax=Beauveria asiatica TaxID=1069075 RepID=A0AAW0RHD2_9HYPO
MDSLDNSPGPRLLPLRAVLRAAVTGADDITKGVHVNEVARSSTSGAHTVLKKVNVTVELDHLVAIASAVDLTATNELPTENLVQCQAVGHGRGRSRVDDAKGRDGGFWRALDFDGVAPAIGVEYS